MKQFALGAIMLLAAISPSYGQDDRSWHLLTRTEGGTISLIKDLTEHECEFARARALGEPATDDEKEAARKRAEALEDARRKWVEDHHCETKKPYIVDGKKVGMDFAGSTSGRSFMTSDGLCVFGYEFGGGITFRPISPGDIKSAECFK